MGIHVCSNEGPHSFPREDTCNNEMAKIHWRTVKIVFWRITGPILTKFSTKHSLVMGIQDCLNAGPLQFSRGDNKEIAKRLWPALKIFFLRITGPVSTELVTKHPWVLGNHVCSNEGHVLFQGEIIVKIYWHTLKIIFSRIKLSTKHPWVMEILL